MFQTRDAVGGKIGYHVFWKRLNVSGCCMATHTRVKRRSAFVNKDATFLIARTTFVQDKRDCYVINTYVTPPVLEQRITVGDIYLWETHIVENKFKINRTCLK